MWLVPVSNQCLHQDIKLQKISPEGKPKIQLQVVLHDGNSTTFHFVNREGHAAQLSDRDKVKELLQQLLPNFKRKVDKELEEKNRILSENANLLQLYKDLVITQVLTSEEFWATHAKDYAALSHQTQATKQEIGVSGAFLADIKPQTDGCNGFRYNLTGDIIECIFKTYPAVKRKHAENVPAKMTESDFWTRFFQSHYFHRDRIAGTTKDIFAECGRIDDQALRADVARGAGDPLLDLRLFEDNTLEEGFGGAASEAPEKGQLVGSGNIVHQNMIKRFNQHSMMVLKTCTEVVPAVRSSGNPSGQGNGHPAGGVVAGESNAKGDEPQAKVSRISEKIRYDDLLGLDEDGKAANDAEAHGKGQLNLMKVERYLHGPMPGAATGFASELMGNGRQDSLSDMNATQANICGLTDGWAMRTPHKALVSATAAVNALGELSPGGSLMRGFQDQSLARKYSACPALDGRATYPLRLPFRAGAGRRGEGVAGPLPGRLRVVEALLESLSADHPRPGGQGRANARGPASLQNGQTEAVRGACPQGVRPARHVPHPAPEPTAGVGHTEICQVAGDQNTPDEVMHSLWLIIY